VTVASLTVRRVEVSTTCFWKCLKPLVIWSV
jgi:hypothetical protein